MIPESEKRSERRPWLLALLVLGIVAAAIALANLSSEPVTAEFLGETVFKGKPARRSFGWPLNWYWRTSRLVPRKIPGEPAGSLRTTARLRWPVSQLNYSRLMVNLSAWLGMLAVAWIACNRLLRRFRPQIRLRPRVATLLLILIVSAAITLANLSFDASASSHHLPPYVASFGWPLIWYWHFVAHVHWTDYSAVRLAGNLAIWLAILSVIGFACQRLLRRRPPRLRWSLRTMLAAVALAAALCGWYVAARRRADEEGPLIASIQANNGRVYVERWGPKWLDIVGADPLCRCIIGASLFGSEEQELDQLRQLQRLPRLEQLEISLSPGGLTPAVAVALSEMRQLRKLVILCDADGGERLDAQIMHELLFAASRLTQLDHLSLWTNFQVRGDDLASLAEMPRLKSLTLGFDDDAEPDQDWLRGISKVTQLERLHLQVLHLRSDDLAQLGALTNLKVLTLECLGERDKDQSETREGEPGMLSQFPILPRLEALDLFNGSITDDDLCRLARFPRLKAIGLEGTYVTDAGLEELAPLESLEELAIGENMATVDGLDSLAALKRLRAVHVCSDPGKNLTQQTLDTGDIRNVLSVDADVARALEVLRQSHPGIVVDADYDGFEEKFQLRSGEPRWGPEQAPDRGSIHAVLRGYIEEK